MVWYLSQSRNKGITHRRHLIGIEPTHDHQIDVSRDDGRGPVNHHLWDKQLTPHQLPAYLERRSRRRIYSGWFGQRQPGYSHIYLVLDINRLDLGGSIGMRRNHSDRTHKDRSYLQRMYRAAVKTLTLFTQQKSKNLYHHSTLKTSAWRGKSIWFRNP